MSPSTPIQIQAITHLLAPTSSTSITCLHHLACVKTPPRQTHCFRISRGFFWRETRRSLGNSSWQSISLRVVAPSLPPVDWSPCCYLAGSPTLTREHRRHRNSQTWLLAPPLFLFCRAFTRADFSTSQFFPLHMWVFGFRLCPKLGLSWC